MGLLSNTGLLASTRSCTAKRSTDNINSQPALELRCEVTPAPYMLRPYAGLYNPFANACSVLCNHPADQDAKHFVKRAKDGWILDSKGHFIKEDLTRFQDGQDKEKIRTPHDIVTEDMFRRYTETDSRPLTPAPTLASGKSRGSRRCLTPDQPHPRTTIVLDLRRSHSQETLYYHGYTTSDMTAGHTSATNDRSTLPSLNLSEATHTRLIKGQCEQLPPLASPLVLSKRAERPLKEPVSVRGVKKIRWSLPHESSDPIRISPNTPNSAQRTPNSAQKTPNSDQKTPNSDQKTPNSAQKTPNSDQKTPNSDQITPTSALKRPLESAMSKNQLKALNINKVNKGKTKGAMDTSLSQGSKGDKTDRETLDGSDAGLGPMDDASSVERRRGKRRRKGLKSDRLTSAGLAAQTQQDPETQVAGIGTDSHNPSSRGSIAQTVDEDVVYLPVIKPSVARKTDSFLDDDILKFLHREVDEEAIETEFDTKRRYVLEEAYRTRPDRPYGDEMQALLRDLKVPAMSLGDWLHIPRLFSRQNAQFTVPIDTNALQTLTPMQYAARFVTIKKSKQLLYLTVLRKFNPEGFRIHIKDIEEALILMMGGMMTAEQAKRFRSVMEWDSYQETDNSPDDIRLTLLDAGNRRRAGAGDSEPCEDNTLKYRTWCGLCAVCERMYGRFPPREKDPPQGMELSDFTMLENKLSFLKVHSGLAEILTAIRVR